MKVIISCDGNNEYLQFWNLLNERFEKIGYTCKLFLIHDHIPDYLKGDIQLLKPIEGISTVVQALWAKFYFTKTEPDTKWFIGDIDQLPLNKEFFDKIANLNCEDEYYCPLPYNQSHVSNSIFSIKKLDASNPGSIPGYYHFAKGKTFERVLELTPTFEEQVRYIVNNQYGVKEANEWSKKATPDWKYFCCEEQYSGELIFKNHLNVFTWGYVISGYNGIPLQVIPNDVSVDERLSLLSTLPMRICRSTQCAFNPLLMEYYIDFHCPRPYSGQNKVIIDSILKEYDKPRVIKTVHLTCNPEYKEFLKNLSGILHQRQDICMFTYPRCGSTFFRHLLGNMLKVQPCSDLSNPEDKFNYIDNYNNKKYRLCKFHFIRDIVRILGTDLTQWVLTTKFINIYRDPLDTFKSFYYFRDSFTLNDVQDYLESLDFFLTKIPESNRLLLSYDKLISDPVSELKKVCVFLNIEYEDIDIEYINKISRETDVTKRRMNKEIILPNEAEIKSILKDNSHIFSKIDV